MAMPVQSTIIQPGTVEQLDERELRAWRGMLRVHATLTKALDAELDAEHGLPLSSYEVLLNLDVEFDPEVSGRNLPGAIQRLEKSIREAHPEVTRVFVEVSSLLRP